MTRGSSFALVAVLAAGAAACAAIYIRINSQIKDDAGKSFASLFASDLAEVGVDGQDV